MNYAMFAIIILACTGCGALFKRPDPSADDIRRLITPHAGMIEFEQFYFEVESGVGGLAFLFRFDLSNEEFERLANEYKEVRRFREGSNELPLEEESLLRRAKQITGENDVPSWFSIPRDQGEVIKLAREENRKHIFFYYGETGNTILGIGYSRGRQ